MPGAGSLDTASTTMPTIETNRNPTETHPHSFHRQTGIQELPCFNDLIAVLIECFSLIAIGYLSGRFKLISPEAKDLGAYLTTFALPMIIFLNVAQMEIKTINLSLLVCMLISKLIIFALVSLITLAITYPTNFSYAGALSILTTQSNDFALGYPLFKSLYGKSNPEMLNYLNLMGPIQLLIINPLGIVMLEFGKSQLRRRLRRERAGEPAPLCGHCLAGADLHRAGARLEQLAEEQDDNIEQGRSAARESGNSLVLATPATSPEAGGQQVGAVGNNVGKPLTGSLLGRHSFEAPTECQSGTSPEQAPESDSRGANWLATIGLNRATRGRPPPAAAEPPAGGRCSCSARDGQVADEPVINFGFLKALMTNPLIIMSLLALAVNLIHGPELPKFVTKVSSTIAASFAAPALLVVGLSMYGKFQLVLSNPNDLLLASVLVITKGMVLPNVMRTVMQVTLPYYVEPQEIQSLVDFSYLYGLLPTAPGACIIAKQYEILTNVVSLGMLLSTIVSAPLMLGTSAVISRATSISPEAIMQTNGQVLTTASSVTLVLSLSTLCLLWKSKGRTPRFIAGTLRDAAVLRSRHLFTTLLTITQLLVGVGGFLWLFVDLDKIKLHSSHPLGLFAQEVALPLAAGSDAASTTSVHWPRVDADYEDEDNFLDQDKRHEALGTAKVLGAVSSSGNSPSITSLACTTGFINASGGLLLTKFLIACIVVTNFIRSMRGRQLAGQISKLMTRVFPLLMMAVVMCLVYESNHLTCRPTEPSLPRRPFSLYFRLMFNAVLLLTTISLFVTTLRVKNKEAHRQPRGQNLSSNANDGLHPATSATGALKKRPFNVSNVSLASGTSSEITTSTSLETSAIHNAGQSQAQKSFTTAQVCAAAADSDTEANLVFDYRHLYARNSSSLSSQESSRQPDGFMCQLRPPGDDRASLDAHLISGGHVCDPNNSHHQLNDFMAAHSLKQSRSHGGSLIGRGVVLGLAEPTIEAPPPASPVVVESWPDGRVKFDRNSILVVFMLFQALLSVTSIVQVIFQHENSGGTFIIVELTNLIVDFGQGLLTFLVLGTQTLLACGTTRTQPTDQSRA